MNKSLIESCGKEVSPKAVIRSPSRVLPLDLQGFVLLLLAFVFLRAGFLPLSFFLLFPYQFSQASRCWLRLGHTSLAALLHLIVVFSLRPACVVLSAFSVGVLPASPSVTFVREAHSLFWCGTLRHIKKIHEGLPEHLNNCWFPCSWLASAVPWGRPLQFHTRVHPRRCCRRPPSTEERVSVASWFCSRQMEWTHVKSYLRFTCRPQAACRFFAKADVKFKDFHCCRVK